jgi:GGDEF domain-containing protein
MPSDQFMDAGTRLLGQGAFEFVLDSELRRAVRAQNFLTLVVLETQREWEGLMLTADDAALTELADIVTREVRATDPIGLTERGTLSLLLLDADFEPSTRVVDRVMARVDNYEFPTPLHISVGAACYPTHAVDAPSLRRQAVSRPIVNWRGGDRPERS